jgi:hypothetical protein
MPKTMTGHDMPLAEAAFIEIAFDEVPNQVTWKIPFPEACNVIVASELVASFEMGLLFPTMPLAYPIHTSDCTMSTSLLPKRGSAVDPDEGL